jgi:predicted metal-dependent hydrolase
MQKEFFVKEVGKVTITKRRNSKKVRLTIRAGGQIRVSIPLYTSYKTALAFVEQNRKCIADKKAAHQSPDAQSTFQVGQVFQTAFHKIQFLETSAEHWHYQQDGEKIRLYVPAPFVKENHEEQFRSFIIEVLRKEAKSTLPEQVYSLAQKFDLSVNKVFIKNLRSIWGSCSGLNNINLNLHLMRLPEELREYVICHELAHLKVRNHSTEFWEYLETLLPGAREKAGALRHYSTQIL